MKKLLLFTSIIALTTFMACKKDDGNNGNTTTTTSGSTTGGPKLIFKFKFDSTQTRLDNLGNVSTIPTGHSAQSPVFKKMSAHYIEMAQNQFTAIGAGKVLYKNAETTIGGSTAIDFSKSIIKGNGEEFYSVPISQLGAGTYDWLRVSLAYQNYDIKYKSSSYYLTGTIASFLGYNTYIGTYTINTQAITVNANKAQGYWGFETVVVGTPYTATGQAPAGATTVPNPIFATSPIPQGSCVVTGKFVDANGNAKALQITGTETSDIIVTVSLSTNKSFEWKDANMDGWYEPTANDTVVDMGIRGLIPFHNK